MIDSIWQSLLQVLGVKSEASQWYAFWSGSGADFSELAIIGVAVTGFHHINCHNKGCWRLGKHTTSKGYKLCKLVLVSLKVY